MKKRTFTLPTSERQPAPCKGKSFSGCSNLFERLKRHLKDTVLFTGNITLADIDSIAILKMELALTRGKYRDYYDLFADSPYFLVGF